MKMQSSLWGAAIKEDLQDEIVVTVIAAGFEKTQDMDILNSPVIPDKSEESPAETHSAPADNAAPSTEDAYKGMSGIDIPTFLKR